MNGLPRPRWPTLVPALVLLFAGTTTCLDRAHAQPGRDQVLSTLTAAARSGNVDAQLALGSLLDSGGRERESEALHWYEMAARAGNTAAQSRYLAMLARPAPAATPTKAFMMRSSRDAMDANGQPTDLPPGYHCHPLGRGQMWCHGGSDAGQ